MNLRAAAARVIYRVLIQGGSLSDCLPETLLQFQDARDQALIQALCYGVCRRYFYLEAMLYELLTHPLKDQDQDIFALLLVGLYQLTDMRIPEYAAVDDTVAAAKDFNKEWAKALINAVLRNYQRRKESLLVHLADNPEAMFSHPDWFIGMLKKSWPEHVGAIMTANNQHPPFALRVNQCHGSREQYLEKLAAQHQEAQIIPETENGIVLSEACDVKLLPGFAAGDISVQDGAAQLAAQLLMLEPGLRVLDACAAPGGKTAHIAEMQPNLAALVAVDNDANRLRTVVENLQRLQLQADCVHSDVAKTQQWWDGQLFDRILLDAPCSASGVIRRHPDIKLLRRPEDVQNLVAEQTRLLTALWACLKIGGVLLYATCSIFPRENSKVLAAFLAEHPDAEEDKITASWGVACDIGRQILPGMHGMDGFYYARLKKIKL